MMTLGRIFARIMPGTVFHAPTAAFPCDDYPNGFQWYPTSEHGQEVIAAAHELDAYLDGTMRNYGLDESQTILIGFSQGTSIALHLGLRRAKSLAGIVGFSGMLELPDRLTSEIKSRPPVLLIHGDSDEVLPAEFTRKAAHTLRENGVQVDMHIAKDVGHKIDQAAVSLAWRFLYRVTGLPVPK
jgi:phospholipase/carboxylesterase